MFSLNMFPQNLNIIFLAMQTLRETLMDTYISIHNMCLYIYYYVNKNANKIVETVNFHPSLFLMCFPGTGVVFPSRRPPFNGI